MLVLTSLTQFLCYLHNKYYVSMFNKAANFRQLLETDDLSKKLESVDLLAHPSNDKEEGEGSQ